MSADPRARAVAGLDQVLAAEHVECAHDCRSADVEFLGEGALGRQALAGANHAPDDRGAQFVRYTRVATRFRLAAGPQHLGIRTRRQNGSLRSPSRQLRPSRLRAVMIPGPAPSTPFSSLRPPRSGDSRGTCPGGMRQLNGCRRVRARNGPFGLLTSPKLRETVRCRRLSTEPRLTARAEERGSAWGGGSAGGWPCWPRSAWA